MPRQIPEDFELRYIPPTGWSFAATADSLLSLPSMMRRSASIEMERKPEFKEPIAYAVDKLAEVMETKYFGEGPFSVACSGTPKGLYLSVKSQ